MFKVRKFRENIIQEIVESKQTQLFHLDQSSISFVFK